MCSVSSHAAMSRIRYIFNGKIKFEFELNLLTHTSNSIEIKFYKILDDLTTIRKSNSLIIKKKLAFMLATYQLVKSNI